LHCVVFLNNKIALRFSLSYYWTFHDSNRLVVFDYCLTITSDPRSSQHYRIFSIRYYVRCS